MNTRMMTTILSAVLVCAAAGTTTVTARQGASQRAPASLATQGAQAAPASKIDALVAAMTLDEKVSMLYGVNDPNSYGQAGHIPGVLRLGVPPLRLSDGPAGIRVSLPATALPAPVAMASTFSPALAKQFGQIVGRDARARHQNVILAPMVNIVRVPQAGRVAGILQMWCPGQEGAEATAAILLGAYSEGIFVGYRWYDQQKIEPLFPFGHGLSYTTFAYSGLHVRRAGDGYDVTLTITNTGTREGVEVPQIYVGPPANAPAPMAVKKLVAFERVSLAPRASKTVTLRVDARGLSYWSTKDHRWTVAGGKRTFMVGSSSRDVKLTSDVTVAAKR